MRNIEEAVPLIVFPLAALVTGVLSGLFGIGGGLLLNPLLLHIGLSPQVASTSYFIPPPLPQIFPPFLFHVTLKFYSCSIMKSREKDFFFYISN